nr:sigma-70 family RNA polymerase sigma factor [Thermoleophilaceae bacterium]
MDLTRDGNERAFEAIVGRYENQLRRYCEKIVPGGRADDAVQQTFMRAYGAIRNGERELDLRPWLYRISHNVCLNLLRQSGWGHAELDESNAGAEQADEVFEQRDSLRSTVAQVQALPPRQRDAIVLRELEGRSFDEIGTELGVNGGAARQILSRARANLREGVAVITPIGLLSKLTESEAAGAAAGASGGAAGGGAATAGAGGSAGAGFGAGAVGFSAGATGLGSGVVGATVAKVSAVVLIAGGAAGTIGIVQSDASSAHGRANTKLASAARPAGDTTPGSSPSTPGQAQGRDPGSAGEGSGS